MSEFKFWAGGYTKEADQGVSTLYLDDAGKLRLVSTAPEPSPSYLDKAGDMLYTAREGKEGGVGAFKIEGDKLSFLDAVDFGAGPCHVYAQDDMIYAACYGAGVLAAIRNQDGKLVCEKKVAYGEADFARGRKPHTHMVCVTPDGKYVCVVDLGLDSIILHKLDAQGLFQDKPDFVQALPDGYGPRHLTFSRDGKFAYVCGEYSNKVTAYAYADGKLTELETKSTLPEGYEEKSYCAGLRFTKDGKFLLITNRGHDSIAVFPVDGAGKLGALKTYSVGGKFPREFALSPDEKFIICANQNSDTLDVLAFDNTTGEMHAVSALAYPAPTAVLFA